MIFPYWSTGNVSYKTPNTALHTMALLLSTELNVNTSIHVHRSTWYASFTYYNTFPSAYRPYRVNANLRKWVLALIAG